MDLTSLLQPPNYVRPHDLTRLRTMADEGVRGAGGALADYEAQGILGADVDAEPMAHYRNVIWTTAHSQTSLMSLAPGTTIPEETHDGFDQLIYVRNGKGTLRYHDGSGDIWLAEGAVVVVPAGKAHTVMNTGRAMNLDLVSFYTSPTAHPVGEKVAK